MLFDIRFSTDPFDHIFFSGIRNCKRHEGNPLVHQLYLFDKLRFYILLGSNRLSPIGYMAMFKETCPLRYGSCKVRAVLTCPVFFHFCCDTMQLLFKCSGSGARRTLGGHQQADVPWRYSFCQIQFPHAVSQYFLLKKCF